MLKPQTLTKEEVQDIQEMWKKNGGMNGHWSLQAKGGLEYITQTIIDVLRLLYNSEIIREIYGANVIIPKRIANDFAKTNESLPSVVVGVNESLVGMRSIGVGITNDDMNLEQEESWDTGIMLTIEGRDKRECDIITSQISTFLILFIVPALGNLGILMLTKYNVSASRERVESTSFKPITRTISFKVKFDYIINEFIVDDPVVQGVNFENKSE